MILFRERVLPSVANMAMPALLFPSVLAVILPINESWAIPVAAFCTLVFVAVIVSSAPVVVLTDTSFSARGAMIEKKLLGVATVVAKKDIFAELGPKLDARSWLAIQASVKGLVKVTVTDSEDPTPYWLVSTRQPEKLAELLNS